MTRVGYIWVSAVEHNAEYQRDLLTQQGVARIYEDDAGGSATPTRPQLTAALDRIAPGDSVVVWRLDRLANTLQGVLTLLDLLAKRGVGVVSLTEGFDTLSDADQPLRRIVHELVELERTMVRERTMVGVYAARSRGRVGGRPRSLSAANAERVVTMRAEGASVREIAQELGTSRATVYRALEEAAAEDEARDAATDGAGDSTRDGSGRPAAR